MFEKILEKVLENYFGRFITGLDRHNLKLGVWSGNVAIENVNLKPEVIDLLELPIKLKNSKIGKMHFKIPWKKLSSQPVEILIDNLYITVVPLQPSEWNFSDQAIVDKKFQLLLDYCRECMQKNLKKKKKQDGEEDQSFLDKLTTKIIDNIQMKISNIHVRWEQEDSNIEECTNLYKMNHSWGITLQSLDVGTTDELWKSQFIDRTEITTRFVAMNRLFELKNLAIYWNANEKNFQKPNDPLSYSDYMGQRILLDDGQLARELSQFIITISSEVKVIQNAPKSVFLPLYHSEISLQWLDLVLKRNQFKQLLNLLENFSVFTNLLWVQRKKAQDVSQQVVSEYQANFFDLFQKVYLSESKQLDSLNESEGALFKSILRAIGYENLIQWTKVVAKKMIKENRVTELTLKKQKKESSWWNAAKQKDKDKDKNQIKDKQTDDLTEQQIQDIEDQIESMFDDHSEMLQDIIRPKDSIENRFEFVFKGGGIQITSAADSESNMRIEEEGIKLIFGDMYCIFEQVVDGSVEVIFKLENLELKLMTQYQGQEVIFTPFLQKSLINMQHPDQFFKVQFQKRVELVPIMALQQESVLQQKDDQSKTQPQVIASLSLQIQPVECIYNPTFVKRFNDFFETQGVDESLKIATWDKIEALQDQTQSKVDFILNSDVKLTLQLDVFSPILILPFSMNNDSKSECWIINLGNLKMSTIQSEIQFYDCYNLDLLEMSFQYYPSKELYYTKVDLDRIYNVVSCEAMNFQIHRLKKSIKDLANMPVAKIDGQIPPLNLKLTTYLHGKLFEIKGLLVPSQSDNEQIEILQNEKYSILKNQFIQGNLKKKDKSMNLWNPYFGVCSGAYIYLFKDFKDIHPEQHVYISRAEITKVESPDQEFAFQIVSRYDKAIFSCKDEEELDFWVSSLIKQINSFAVERVQFSQVDIQSSTNLDKLKSKQIETPSITYLQIRLDVQELTLTLQQNNMKQDSQMEDIYFLQVDKFMMAQTIATNKILTEYSINSLCLTDHIYKYNNPEYQTFIRSVNQSDKFLNIQMVSSRVDPSRDDWVSEVIYDIGQFSLNWKPDVILQMMKLYRQHQSNDIISLQDDEAELKLKGFDEDQIRSIKLNKLIEKENQKQINLLQQKIDQSYSKYYLNQETLLQSVQHVLNLFTQDMNPMTEDQFKSSLQVLIKTTIKIHRAQINLLHHQTHTCLGQVQIEGLSRVGQQTQIASFFHGEVNDLTILDISNYPNTVDSDKEFEWCQPNKIFQKGVCNYPMLVFDQSQFNRDNLNQIQTNFLKVQLSPILLNYMHQPFQRWTNYFTIQVLALLQTPEYLTMNQDFKNSQRKPKLVPGSVQQIFRQLFDPTFSCIELIMDSPIIALARNFDDQNRMEIHSKSITYSNKQSQEPQRLQTPCAEIDIPIWCDTININIDQLCLTINDGVRSKQISNFSTYQVEWTKVLNFNELCELFPSVSVKNYYNIKSYMTPMNLHLMHQEYQYICSVFMHNITNDDQQDCLFIHDYELYKSFAIIENRSMIYFPQFSLYMKNDQDQLIANMQLSELQIEYLLEQNTNKSMKFFAKDLEFSEFIQTATHLEQIVIIGRLGFKQRYQSTKEVHMSCIQSNNLQAPPSQQRDFKTNFSERQERKSSMQRQNEQQSYQFLTDIIIEKNSPTKEMIISFNNVGMSAKSRRVFQLIEWLQLTEDCYPKNNRAQPNGLSIMINYNNGFLTFPTKRDQDNILTARGNINYIFDKQPFKPEKTQNSHKITLSNLELFINQESIRNKRQIVLPVLLYFGVQDNFDRIFLVRKIDCTFDRTCIKVSNEDLFTISSAIEYQIDQFDHHDQIVEQDSPTLDYYMLSSSTIPKVYKTLLTFNCIIYGIQVVVISGQEIPVPFFDLFLNECQISYTSKSQQYLFNVKSQIQSSHYNNSLGMWEPFIEPFIMQVDYSYNQEGNPKQNTTIVFNPEKFEHIPININITAPIIMKLQNLFQVWQDTLIEVIDQKNQLKQSSLESSQQSAQDIETIQDVSPYIINNKTGHQIEISALTKTFAYVGGATQINEPIKTIIEIDERQSIKFATNYDSLFQQSFSTSDRYTIERRRLTIKIKSQFSKFSEVKNIDFDKLYNKKVQLEMSVAKMMHKLQMVIDLRQIGDYKQLTISSDIQVNNRTQRTIQIKVISNFDNSKFIEALIQANDIYYIPLGYENAILQFRFHQKEQIEWSKYIDLGKVRSQNNDATFDLCPQSLQSLILLVSKPNQQNQFLQMMLQCPLVIHNTLPVSIWFRIQGVEKQYSCEGYQQIKVAERQPNQEFKVQVKLPGFQLSNPIMLVGRQPSGQAFIVRDYLGVELKLSYVYIGQQEGFFTFLLEGGMVIYQTIGRPLYFYGRYLSQKEKETKTQVPVREGPLHPQMEYLAGQIIPGITEEEDLMCKKAGSLMIANEYELMQVSFEQGGETQSNRQQFLSTNNSLQFPVKDGVGRYQVRIPLQGGYMDTVAQTTNIVIDNRMQVIAPMLTISPKCIIVNHFNRDITVRQNGVSDQEILIPRGQRVPLYWFTYFSRYMQFYYKSGEELCRTGYMGLEISGTLTCPTRRVGDSAIQDYILVSSIEDQKIQLIKVEPPREHTKPLYLVQNRLSGIKIQFYQSCYDEININLKTVVQSYEEQSYAFDHPTHPKQLNVEIIGENNAYIGMIVVNLTHANWSDQQNLLQPNNTKLSFYINSYFSITHKQIVVCFQEQKPMQSHELEVSDMLAAQLDLALPQLTISIISNTTHQIQKRKELILINIKAIEVVQISDHNIQTTQIKVSDLQIDSNRINTCRFPVLLTSKNKEGHEKSKIPIISCVVQRAHNVTFVNYFKSIKVAIQPLAIKATEGTLEDLYMLYLQLSAQKDSKQLIELNDQQRTLLNPQHAWQQIDVQSSQLCFIERVEVYPIIFNLSFLMVEATGRELKRLIKPPPGQSFMSCDEASIKLHGVVAENIQQTPTQFMYRLSSNYQDDFNSNLLKLIGSMEILGNPMGLVRNVGEGFQDLWEMPKEGFIKGPIEGGIGIAKGVGSLTKGVVAGTFNTVQKITGSLAQGFSAITMDDEYQKDRAEMGSKKPKHLVDGLGQGMISLFTGVGQGIAGLILQPVQGAERNGIEGFFKGTLKGLAGLVVKPVVGVMDMTSKTAEGIKNTANYFDDKCNENRYRPPRVFYSSEQFYKNYKIQDSEVVSLLQKINPAQFKETVELIECIPNQILNRLFVYVITINHFILLDVNNKNIKFDAPSRWISKIEMPSEKQLYVYLLQPLKNVDSSKTAGFSHDHEKIKLLSDNTWLIKTLFERLNHLVQIIHEQ